MSNTPGWSEQMAKMNHQKRQRPRPLSIRRRGLARAQAIEQRTRREVERWRRGS
jgi:hypothetical protein